MTERIFELNNICYSYLGKFPALNGINLDILPGEKVSIIGANGCGKSTLLQMLDGLIFPDKGKMSAFGKELSENAFNDEKFSLDFRKRVGFVFQDPNIQLFCPTVKEDILFGPTHLGMGNIEMNNRLEKLIEVIGIQNLLDRSPHQLSIGERRKVAIASTLITDPEVIILDEPMAGLDPTTTRHIIDLLIDENIKGKTIITSTHDLHIVEEMAGIVSVFGRDKKIVKFGRPEEILQDTEFLKQNNLGHIHGHTHHGKVHVHEHVHIEHHAES